jgi:DNA-binding response OmpR family regulator
LDLPDLIVTDATMPELDGFQLAEALRRDDRTHRSPHLPDRRDRGGRRARALELGALAYMSKPFEPTAFALLVTGVLARFARRNGPSLDTALRRAATVTSVEPGTAA